MNRKGEITNAILQSLVFKTLTTKALLISFLSSGRNSYVLRKSNRKALKEAEKEYYKFLEKQRLYSLISKLKKDGLIIKGQSGWIVTGKGKGKLNELKIRLTIKNKNYENRIDNQFKIVIFDIPEKYRRGRDWLRSALRSLGFTMLQKSVWAGNVTIPPDFIEDLSKMNILSYVQIFSVNKKGTLEDFLKTQPFIRS